MTFTIDEIVDRLNALPEDLRAIFFSISTRETITEIVKKYNLNEDQEIELGALVGDVLMGLEKMEDVGKLLRERKVVLGDTADAVVAELDQRIFLRAKPYIEEFLGEKVVVGPPSFASVAPPPIPGRPRISIAAPSIERPSRFISETPAAPLETLQQAAEPKKFEFEWEAPSIPPPPEPPAQNVIEISQEKAAEEEKRQGPIDLSRV